MNIRTTEELITLLNKMRAETALILHHLDQSPESNNRDEVLKWECDTIDYYRELENKYKILNDVETLKRLKEHSNAIFRIAHESLIITRSVLDKTRDFLNNFNIAKEENYE